MASYRKRGKTWQYRVTYIDDNGDRRELSKSGFTTKAEARVAAEKVEYELNIGVNVEKGEMLFLDYYKQWIETYKTGAYSIDNDKSYERFYRLAEEYFTGVKLNEVTHEFYQRFLNDYSTGRAKETVRKAHNKIGAPLRFAFNSGHIPFNPTFRIVLRGTEGASDDDKHLQEYESKALLEALLDGIQYDYLSRYMLILQLATGARISEIMALQFKDFNFLNNRIEINKSWDYKYQLDFIPTKNKETRNISVDQKTMGIIKDLYDYQVSKKIVDSKQRIFAAQGKVPSVNAVNKALRRACRRAEVKEVTSHALRHTHASLLILNGVSVVYISKRLGHQSIDITTKVYSHVLEELELKSEKESADFMLKFYD